MWKVVIPGEIVSQERKKLGSHVFVQNGKICSEVLGVTNQEAEMASVIPLKGAYMPRMNDIVVGVISSEKFAGYTVNINSFYESFISKKELRDPVSAGTVITARVSKVNELNEVDLEGVRVFFNGEILNVSPVKVPRLIGKNNSMLNVLKDNSKANIVIGRNGLVWLKGENIELLIKAIRLIEREAHSEHLTERVNTFLKTEMEKHKKK